MSEVLQALYPALKNAVADVRENEPIAQHVTVKVGGPAALMLFPHQDNELADALRILQSAGDTVDWFVMGHGANLFADSAGYDGALLNLSHWEWDFEISPDGVLTVGGGLDMQKVVEAAARQGWSGINFMAVVPGTIGGAVVINAGTHSEGGFIADRFLWAETLTLTGEHKRYTREEMNFGYRLTRLLGKHEIVMRAAFQLTPCDTPNDLLATFKTMRRAREEKFPMGLPNFGSTFRSPGAPHPPAGKLIDELGMKGLPLGGARISEKHGNFIVNVDHATSSDIIGLMERMRQAVFDKFGVWLRPEVRYLCSHSAPCPDFLQ